jgi:hypothetical protein
MRNIGLIGKARAGKDSAAAHLVATQAYTRLAFADPLKEAALKINPFVDGFSNDRLADIVDADGWEYAKDVYPEVRRILQHIGQIVREIDEDFWLRECLRKVAGATKLNMPVVITDVRYANEAESLRRAGFLLVRIVRPARTIELTGAKAVSARRLSDASAAHASETELDGYPADFEISNAGSLADLGAAIGSLTATP